MADTLYATFADATHAVKAVGALLDHGLHNEEISVVSKNPYFFGNGSNVIGEEIVNRGEEQGCNAKAVNHRTGEGDSAEYAAKRGISTTTPGDAFSGAAKGAGIGLGVGVTAGLASILLPGIGLVAGGGALAAAAAGAAGVTAAGAVAGGVYGYLKDQGVPHECAQNFDHAYQNGWALLSVHIPPESLDEKTIEGILWKYNAHSVDTYNVAAPVAQAIGVPAST